MTKLGLSGAITILAVAATTAVEAEQNNLGAPVCATQNQRECDMQLLQQMGKGSTVTQLDAGWQLVRTRNPSGGADAVSIMHVADTRRSDPGLAGLSFSCQRDGAIGVALILLQPMSPDFRPRVRLESNAGHMSEVEASTDPAGRSLLLPLSAQSVAALNWQQAAEINVAIESNKSSIHGTIRIEGYAPALRLLNSTCPTVRY